MQLTEKSIGPVRRLRKRSVLIPVLGLMLVFWSVQESNAASPQQDANNLILLSEEFPPYNFSVGNQARGISIELMMAICRRLSLDDPPKTLQLLPWPRAYKRLLEEKNAVLFATTRTLERESLFKWVGPISKSRNVLLARKDRHIKIVNLKDAGAWRIGVIPDDAGEQLLVAAGVPAATFEKAQDARSNLLKLQSGRIDLFAYDENVSRWTLGELGFNDRDYEGVFTIREGEHYFAFNKQTSDQVILMFQKTLDALKREGIYQGIIDSYLK